MKRGMINLFLKELCRGKHGCFSLRTSKRRLLHTSCSCNVVHKSPFPDLEIPKKTITEVVMNDFNQFGTTKALIDGVTGRTLTFDQLKDSIWRIASGMSKQGFGKGDVLLIISENSIDYILVLHAALSLGGIVTTCNCHYLVDDIVRQVLHSNANYIYCSHLFGVKTREILNMTNSIKKVFVSGSGDGFIPISLLLEDDGVDFPSNPVADPMSMALLPYSSGTTGLSKGVMLTHYAEVANCLQIDVEDYMPEKGKDRQIAILPFYHIYGIITHCLAILKKGLTSVVLPGFEPKLFLDSIQNYGVGMAHLVPPILTFLTKHEMVSKYNLESLNRVISGAAPLGLETTQQFKERFPWCTVGQGYGMTETGPVITITSGSGPHYKPGSCGPLIPNTLLKVLDSDQRELPTGKAGELYTKGPQMMTGYLNNPKATKETIDEDGWLRTGDIGYMDKDGLLYIVDRVKELIKFKGLQVPPAELEDILCSHPSVADAAVVGLPDSEAGEVPKAFVSLKQGAVASVEELQEFINQRVVSYKRLRGGITFIPKIPRSPSGKILRKDLRSGLK